jgi:hypothetical protein
MSSQQGISFLYQFDLGNYNLTNFGANILSVTSTAAGDFDKGNLTTDILSQTWRSANTIGWQEIVIEADVQSRIDTFAILNHNLSETAIVYVQANISNNFLAPPVNFLVPYQEKHLILCQDFGAAYKYYKVKILDPANACGYIEIGRIVGGRAFTFDNSKGEDITDDIDLAWEDYAETMKTEGFFRVSNERIKTRTLSVNFSKLNTIMGMNKNWLGLRHFINYVGVSKPFLTIVDRNDPSFISLWGQLKDLPNERFTINRFVNLSLKIEETW